MRTANICYAVLIGVVLELGLWGGVDQSLPAEKNAAECCSESLPVVEDLLDRGMERHSASVFGKSALNSACCKSRLTVRRLSSGGNPLRWVCTSGVAWRRLALVARFGLKVSGGVGKIPRYFIIQRNLRI